MFEPLEIDALFLLECSCIQDGHSDSNPGKAFRAGQSGKLYCFFHRRWEMLVDVVIL